MLLSREIDPDRKVNVIVCNEESEPRQRNRAMAFAHMPEAGEARRAHLRGAAAHGDARLLLDRRRRRDLRRRQRRPAESPSSPPTRRSRTSCGPTATSVRGTTASTRTAGTSPSCGRASGSATSASRTRTCGCASSRSWRTSGCCPSRSRTGSCGPAPCRATSPSSTTAATSGAGPHRAEVRDLRTQARAASAGGWRRCGTAGPRTCGTSTRSSRRRFPRAEHVPTSQLPPAIRDHDWPDGWIER